MSFDVITMGRIGVDVYPLQSTSPPTHEPGRRRRLGTTVAELESTRAARSEHERHKRTQRSYLSTHERVETP
jgi:hypothetical protein